MKDPKTCGVKMQLYLKSLIDPDKYKDNNLTYGQVLNRFGNIETLVLTSSDKPIIVKYHSKELRHPSRLHIFKGISNVDVDTDILYFLDQPLENIEVHKLAWLNTFSIDHELNYFVPDDIDHPVEERIYLTRKEKENVINCTGQIVRSHAMTLTAFPKSGFTDEYAWIATGFNKNTGYERHNIIIASPKMIPYFMTSQFIDLDQIEFKDGKFVLRKAT